MKKLLIFIALMTVMLSSVYAACTFVTPATSGTISGNTLFNATCATSSNPTNCTVTASSSRTGDSESFTLYNTTTWLNATIATASTWQNAEDWSISGTCYNISGSSETLTAITGVSADNSNPRVLSLTQLGTVDDTAVTVYGLIANATTYTCYHRGNSIKTATATYSFTGTNVSCRISLDGGNQTWNITGYDGISYGGTADSYDMISGYAYVAEKGGMIDGTPTGMTYTKVSEQANEKAVQAKQEFRSAWVRFTNWLKNLFN